jgi:hypothetical protein
MPHGSGHVRQHRSRPAIRRPRVPAGQRLVREGEWLTTDHPEACWYRLVDHRSDWGQVRLEVTAEPDDEATEITVAVLPNGYVIAQVAAECLGAEAIRIIATAIRATQRSADT